jgi:hypothetical protein
LGFSRGAEWGLILPESVRARPLGYFDTFWEPAAVFDFLANADAFWASGGDSRTHPHLLAELFPMAYGAGVDTTLALGVFFT